MAQTMIVPNAQAERRFYTGAAVAMIAFVFIGFAPSFYLRGLVVVPRPNPDISPLVMVHGLMFSAWMLIFLAQVRLVASGRLALHRRLGQWSFAFAASLIPLMVATTIGQVARANQPPDFTPLAWTAIPAIPIPLFAAFLVAGWAMRRDPQAHKRMMLCAAMTMMDPAIGRLPVFPPGIVGMQLSDFAGWLPFLALVVWDLYSRRAVHWTTALCTVGWGIMLLARQAAVVSDWWPPIARSILTAFGAV